MMKHCSSMLLAGICLTTLWACHGPVPQPAFPPSKETLALRRQYQDKMAGDWTYESETEDKAGLKTFEQYHFSPNGDMTGIVRRGSADSVEITWQEGSTSAHGATMSLKKTRKFRYYINDTISGQWELRASEGVYGNTLILYVDPNGTNANKQDSCNAFTDMYYNRRCKFRSCDGLKLLMDDCLGKEATFTKGIRQPTF